MSGKRRRDQCEYLREYRIKKKEKAMMSKREKSERYYMGKEDVKVVAATLAPPSPYSTLPSVPSFVPSHMEEEVGAIENLCLGKSKPFDRWSTKLQTKAMTLRLLEDERLRTLAKETKVFFEIQ